MIGLSTSPLWTLVHQVGHFYHEQIQILMPTDPKRTASTTGKYVFNLSVARLIFVSGGCRTILFALVLYVFMKRFMGVDLFRFVVAHYCSLWKMMLNDDY